MDFAALQIAVIFLPGVIAQTIDERYSRGEPEAGTRFLTRIFLYGTVAHVAAIAIYTWSGAEYDLFSIDEAGTLAMAVKMVDEIATATAAALLLAVTVVVVRNLHWVEIISEKVNLGGFPSDDTWALLTSTNWRERNLGQTGNWVVARDLDKGLSYVGYLTAASDQQNAKVRELVLRDVDVYDEAGTRIRSAEILYIGLPVASTYLEYLP